jgi:hypothetical protein
MKRARDGIGIEKTSNVVDIKLCQVCSANKKQYTCPKCNIGYCSSTCYKSHVCELPAPILGETRHFELGSSQSYNKEDRDRKKQDRIENEDEDQDDETIRLSVPIESLTKLRLDLKLSSALKDSRLVSIFKSIDNAKDRGKALDVAKKKYGKDFTIILDRMLVVIGAAKEQDGGEIVYTGLQESSTSSGGGGGGGGISVEKRLEAELKIAKVTEVVLYKDD